MIAWLLKLATGNPLAVPWIAGGIFLAGLAAGAGGAWKATDKLIAAGKAREQRAAEAVKAARSEAAGLAASIATLRALPKPPGPPAELCDQARRLLDDEVGSRAR